MRHEQVIVRISKFARLFRAGQYRTTRQIYQDTGYAEVYTEISQLDIEIIVARSPELIDEWIGYSTDKRWEPAWCFCQRGEQWIVSHFQLKKTRGNYEIVFDSPFAACALMIRLDMEDLRLSQR